ncbi:MAG: PQ-loop domain-containing transporter [Patescibacteria group bacterium]
MNNALLRRLCPGKHHHIIDLIGEINAVIGGLAAYPQLYRTLTTQAVAGLSLSMFVIIAVTNIVWIIYGIHRKALPVIIASALNLVASGWLVILIFLWRTTP